MLHLMLLFVDYMFSLYFNLKMHINIQALVESFLIFDSVNTKFYVVGSCAR